MPKTKSPLHVDHGSPQGRLALGEPIATIDIGSNSVRLVVYEGLTRSPTPLFNEKVMCGLGRKVASTGRMGEEAVARALKALRRFRVLCDMMRVSRIFIVATAAARDAQNGPEFIAAAQEACGHTIDVISGPREAMLSGYGVVSGVYAADGVMGDMGGGSLELTYVRGKTVGTGISLPLGSLALQDASNGSVKRAEKLVRDMLDHVPLLDMLEGRTFYAVGGTWRALMRLHMSQRDYPLKVTHGYCVSAREMIDFAKLVEKTEPEELSAIDTVSEARRDALAYGAVLLDEIIRRGKPRDIMISAQGVREGMLYEMLDEDLRTNDPLIATARDLNTLRSRSPQHADDLIAWMDQLWASLDLIETPDQIRLRQVACLLSDMTWRAHPDYRGEQALNMIVHAPFLAVSHPERVFVALAVYLRYEGLGSDQDKDKPAFHLRTLLDGPDLERARIVGAAFRVAFLISAAMPGILPRVPLRVQGKQLVLDIPDALEELGNERLANRMKQLAKLLNVESALRV